MGLYSYVQFKVVVATQFIVQQPFQGLCQYVRLTLEQGKNCFCFFSKLSPRNYEGNHTSSFLYIEGWAIFQYYIQRCIGNTIFNIMLILTRVVSITEINNITRNKIVRLSFVFLPQNCKGNHMPYYLNMDEGTFFKYSILKCQLHKLAANY